MEREILEEAQRGSRRAFEEIVNALVDRLYSTATFILHDAALAEDAVQETMIQVWRDLPRLREPDRFEAWLHSILIHRCLDLVRRTRRTATEVTLADWVGDNTNIERAVADRDLVGRGLGRLRPSDRCALVLRYYLGLTVPQIAVALRIPLGTAKSRLHAAEAAMRSAIDGDTRLALQGGMA